MYIIVIEKKKKKKKIKHNVLLSSYLDSWWHQTLRFIFDQPVSNGWQGEKAEDRNTKIWKCWEQKCFLDEMKNICHSFWRAIILWEIKIWSKIAGTSFKLVLLLSDYVAYILKETDLFL